jgi:hypothetical protein
VYVVAKMFHWRVRIVLDLFLIADAALAIIAFVGTYYSRGATKLYTRDIMERVFGYMTVAFLLVGCVSVIDLVFRMLGFGLTDFLLFPATGIVSLGLIVAGLISLLRWAGQLKAQKNEL